jgi:phosphate/sulfate permease
MALIEDMFKGNLAAGLAIGVGAIIFGPTVVRTVGSILRPAAKPLIKNGMVSTAKP